MSLRKKTPVRKTKGHSAKADVIVIGTGLGGSAAAAVLAAEGLDVLVLEKNGVAGGVCASYRKDGFKVDVGTHMFTRGHKGPFGRIGKRVGAQVPRFRVPPYLTHIKAMGADVEVPARPWTRPDILLSVIRQFKLTPREIIEAARFLRVLLTLDGEDIRALEHVSMWDFITRYTDNARLIGGFGLLLGLYFILPLREVSAGEGIWCFQQMVRNGYLSYPEGGAERVPLSLLEAAERHGARLERKAAVTKIMLRSGAVQGVALADGREFVAPVVVATTSLKDIVENLVGPQHFPDEYVTRVRELKPSMIAVQAKIALKRPLIRAGSLVGAYAEGITVDNITTDDFDKMYAAVVAGRIPHMIPIYAPIPTNFDPRLGPPGQQLITACAVAPISTIDLVDPARAWVDAMMSALRAMIPNLDDELLWVDTMNVKWIGSWMGKIGAPAVSCGQTTDQVGNRRPPVRLPIRGLYAAGCGAGGRGVGTELAAASGEEAADAVVQDWCAGLLGRATRPARRFTAI